MFSNYCGFGGRGKTQHKTDKACKSHDKAYGKIGFKAYTHWNKADEQFQRRLYRIYGKGMTWREWVVNNASKLFLNAKKRYAPVLPSSTKSTGKRPALWLDPPVSHKKAKSVDEEADEILRTMGDEPNPNSTMRIKGRKVAPRRRKGINRSRNKSKSRRSKKTIRKKRKSNKRSHQRHGSKMTVAMEQRYNIVPYTTSASTLNVSGQCTSVICQQGISLWPLLENTQFKTNIRVGESGLLTGTSGYYDPPPLSTVIGGVTSVNVPNWVNISEAFSIDKYVIKFTVSNTGTTTAIVRGDWLINKVPGPLDPFVQSVACYNEQQAQGEGYPNGGADVRPDALCIIPWFDFRKIQTFRQTWTIKRAFKTVVLAPGEQRVLHFRIGPLIWDQALFQANTEGAAAVPYYHKGLSRFLALYQHGELGVDSTGKSGTQATTVSCLMEKFLTGHRVATDKLQRRNQVAWNIGGFVGQYTGTNVNEYHYTSDQVLSTKLYEETITAYP